VVNWQPGCFFIAECCAVRASKGDWITGGAIVAAVAAGGLFFAWGVESLLGLPSVVWVLVGLLPVYWLWRRVSGQPALEARQVGLIIVAVIALDAAFDAVLWGAKAALFAAALVLVWAARRRAAAAGRT
jgi:hypothetical protein